MLYRQEDLKVSSSEYLVTPLAENRCLITCLTTGASLPQFNDMFWKKKEMNELIAIGDTVPFALRLAETIVWCEAHVDAADPKDSLRNETLQPHWLFGNRSYIVNQVVLMRSSSLLQQKISPVRSASDLKGGRLMVYFPDADLADGAAGYASRGFFDVHNLPAWDTWVGLFHNPGPFDSSYSAYLVAYVPQALLSVVDDGIEVNPEACIMWLADSNTFLRDQLRDNNILT